MDVDTYKQKVEAEFFFERLIDRLNKICIRHRMYLSRFEQEAPCWTLRGTSPKGGKVDIAIYYIKDNIANISIGWSKLDYEMRKIFVKSKRIYSGNVNEENIERLLEKATRELLDIKEGNWEKEIEYPEWSEKYKNKEEWIKAYGLDLPPIE